MFSFALHGGAGATQGQDYLAEIDNMTAVCAMARLNLERGASALDVVTDAVEALEASGLYVAGRGASPNSSGRYELDASLMNGPDRRAGAVGALEGFVSPIRVARRVMETTPHVFLVGDGAKAFATAQTMAEVKDPATYYLKAALGDENHLPGALAHGTVGAVCLDKQGHLAAATSTAGVFGKMPGRIGDSPVIGAGCWADTKAAISCTGQGEFFIRAAAAAQLAFRVAGGMTLAQAADAVLAEITALGGSGGLIAIDHSGHITMPFSTQGMKRAAFTDHSPTDVAVF